MRQNKEREVEIAYRFLDSIAYWMGYKNPWYLQVKWVTGYEGVADNVMASVDVDNAYKRINVTLRDGYFNQTQEKKMATLVHEAVHFTHAGLDALQLDWQDACARKYSRSISRRVNQYGEEQATILTKMLVGHPEVKRAWKAARKPRR